MYDLRKDLAELDKPNIYDVNYLENMLRMYSKTAEDICKRRWNFVKECNAETILDYGCGCGWFRCWRPKHIEMDSYDINSSALQTGITRKEYDLVCFWDVLEHMPNFIVIKSLLDNAKYIAITVPIKPDDIELKDWRHTKPLEHIHVFSHKIINTIFATVGYELIKKSQCECPPRVDIWSYLYKHVRY